jgi:hypothetical protein
MKRHFYAIIDDCIDWFRSEIDRIINLCLLDFCHEVFHHHGRKSELTPAQIRLLLSHAQAIVRKFGFDSPEVNKLGSYIEYDVKRLQVYEPELAEIFAFVFQGKALSPAVALSSPNIERLISLLPVKEYWDNSGVIYQRRHIEDTFEKAYLWQFKYEVQQRKPAEVKWREIEIPANISAAEVVETKLRELETLPYRLGADYFRLREEDERLYDLYGQLFDLLNWGATNPANIQNYLDVRAKTFELNLFYFPIVFQGIYYGIASVDLPSDFFVTTRSAAEKLCKIISKGKMFVNYYFPSLIMDAYNSRLINRFSSANFESVWEVVNAVSVKVPYHFCYDRKRGDLYYFEFSPEVIGKRLKVKQLSAGLSPNSGAFRENLAALSPALHVEQVNTLEQTILGNDLVFVFDVHFFPGKKKVLPILESHLGVAAHLLETLKARHQRDLVEARSRLLDTFAHEEKTSMELLIADLEDGLDPDLAVHELRRVMRAKAIMRNRLLRQLNTSGGNGGHEMALQVNFQDMVVELFCKAFRVWLKHSRFRQSFERNRHPDLPLSPASTKAEAEAYFKAFFGRYPEKDWACLEILRHGFDNLSSGASFRIDNAELNMLEHAQIRLQEILYNLFCNFFLHVAASPITQRIECNFEIQAIPSDQSAMFKFALSNSTSLRERFRQDIQKILIPGNQGKGLQIISDLLLPANGERYDMKICHENYIWNINIERECRGCSCLQNQMVFSDS